MAADRVTHCFFNHALYPASVDGRLDKYKPTNIGISMWEAEQMSTLAIYRGHYTGRCDGIDECKEYWRKEKEKSLANSE